MSLETASYISQLVPANPTSTDAIASAQNHLALIKSVLQTQFPGLGAAAVTATAADLYAGIGTAVTGLGTNAVLKTPVGGAGTLQTVSGPLGVVGAVNATSIQKNGAELLPTGVIVMWSGASTAIPAGWLLCNGTAGTPNLEGQFVIGAGGVYGPGATGGATQSTPTTSSAGSHNHGGASAVAGPFGMTGSADVQGSHNHGGSALGSALTTDQLPPHSHSYGVSIQGLAAGGANIGVIGSSATYQTGNTGSGNPHNHVINLDGLHTHNIAVSNSPAHSHGISTDGAHSHSVTVPTLPPYYALCFIMKQ